MRREQRSAVVSVSEVIVRRILLSESTTCVEVLLSQPVRVKRSAARVCHARNGGIVDNAAFLSRRTMHSIEACNPALPNASHLLRPVHIHYSIVIRSR